MTGKLVSSERGVTVIGGGLAGEADLREALAVAPQLVAADGGADRALAQGHEPDWVIGDMDSISADARRRIAAGRIVAVAEQDSTDFAKCLTRIAAPFVMAVGFAGRRLDHTLAVLNTMVRLAHPPVILLTQGDVVFRAPPRLTLPLIPGTRVSLWPMGPARGISTGLEWPIEGIDFAADREIGTSNRATGPVSLQVQGPMLLMLPRDRLATVLQALDLPRP